MKKNRPIVGIPMQTLEPIPGQTPLCWIMGYQYVKVLTELGCLPWLIPALMDDLDSLRGIYEKLDGLFLTGGVDVDPRYYNETKDTACGRTDIARDTVEFQFIRWAMEDRKPVLGVCRGAQVINVACGGTLFQDVAKFHSSEMKHDFFPTGEHYSRDMLAHTVKVEKGTTLHGILGSDTAQVNSMHHQGVKQLATTLRANAFAPDGLIEGVEGTNGQFLIGVQWHPEELTRRDGAMRRLFESFVETVNARTA